MTINHTTVGTYEGTGDLVEILIAESKHAYGWRPGRAGLLYALRESRLSAADDDTVYMTPERFETWLKEAKAISKARGDGLTVNEILGLTTRQIKAMKSGLNNRPARGVTSRAIALACAHYTMGLEMPVPAEDWRALDAWYRPRFGGTDRVIRWMRVNEKTLADRLRGYSLRGEERVAMEPEAYWVRALDWLYTVGPVCPYGEKPAVDIWPGQAAALGG